MLDIQNDILEVQNDILDNQNKMVEVQGDILDTQNATLEVQNDILDNQNNIVEIKNYILDIQDDIMEVQDDLLDIQNDTLGVLNDILEIQDDLLECKGSLNTGTPRKRETVNENRPSGWRGRLSGESYVEVKCSESLELVLKNRPCLVNARTAETQEHNGNVKHSTKMGPRGESSKNPKRV